MYTTNSPTQQNVDLPITAMCIVTDKARCPPNYTPLARSHDTGAEPDLWKDSLFGKRINRYFCYTKDYPINDTYNVVEDIKIVNERDSVPGFIPLERCLDTSEKTFQKKTVNIKVSHRYYTTTAVSDIILLVKSRRPPVGYSYIGEINNHAVCIKFSQIPSPTSTTGNANRSSMVAGGGGGGAQGTPPPIPPRPHSNLNPLGGGGGSGGGGDPILNDYVNVPRLPPVPPQWSHGMGPTNGGGGGFPIADLDSHFNELNFNPHRQSLASTHTQAGMNPLHGVPFQINPVYSSNIDSGIQNELIDADRIQRKIASFKQTMEKTKYDFSLERQLIASSP